MLFPRSHVDLFLSDSFHWLRRFLLNHLSCLMPVIYFQCSIVPLFCSLSTWRLCIGFRHYNFPSFVSSIGEDLAPSLGGREKFRSPKFLNEVFLGINFHFHA